jgi:ATP-dependent Clp protease ATP-binding subunit ClpC
VFEHFTDSARRVLVLAQGEAQRRNDSSIDPKHVLLALLREDDGTAAKALSVAGVDYSRATEVTGINDRERARPERGTPPFSAATMSIIETSVQISWDQADGVVHTEHLLVALLQQQDEATESVLAEVDITPQEVVRQVNALLAERSL